MINYRIANTDIAVDAAGVDRIYGFAPFRTEEGKPSLTVRMGRDLSDWAETPLHSFLAEGYMCHYARRDEKVLFRMIGQEKGDTYLTEISPAGDGFEASTTMDASTHMMLVRFGLWVIYGVAAIKRQVVSIHSSAIIHEGRAILFLGESGTGKSTHTRLWMANIPGAELLNDDSPMLGFVDGAPYAFGSPWSGKTHCYKNTGVPLAAVVRLSQAPRNAIRRLSPIASFGAIQPSCPPSFSYDEVISEQLFAILSAALRSVPAYHLECLPDAAAAHLVLETLKNDGML